MRKLVPNAICKFREIVTNKSSNKKHLIQLANRVDVSMQMCHKHTLLFNISILPIEFCVFCAVCIYLYNIYDEIDRRWKNIQIISDYKPLIFAYYYYRWWWWTSDLIIMYVHFIGKVYTRAVQIYLEYKRKYWKIFLLQINYMEYFMDTWVRNMSYATEGM